MAPKKKSAGHGGNSTGSASSSKGSPAVSTSSAPAAAPGKGSKAPVSGSASSKPSSTTDTAPTTPIETSTGGLPPLAPAPPPEEDSESESLAAGESSEQFGSSGPAALATASALKKLTLSIPHAGRVVVAANWAEKMAEEIKDAREMVARAMEYEKWIQDWNKFRLKHSEQTHIPHPGNAQNRPQVDFDLVSQHLYDLYNWYASQDYVQAYDKYVSESMGQPEFWPAPQEFTTYEAKQRLEPLLVSLRKHMMTPNSDRKSGRTHVFHRLRVLGYNRPTCDVILKQVMEMDWSTLPLKESAR